MTAFERIGSASRMSAVGRFRPADNAMNLRRYIVTGALAVCLVGCGFVHDEHLVGPYHLVAVDSVADMGICYELDSGDCAGRITETVFAAGWDTRYVVAKRHPQDNRAKTDYFILEIARDSQLADPKASVTGPLSAEEFAEKRDLLKLPEFSRTIESLK